MYSARTGQLLAHQFKKARVVAAERHVVRLADDRSETLVTILEDKDNRTRFWTEFQHAIDISTVHMPSIAF